MIDIHSDTWKAVKKHCQDSRKDCVKELIEGSEYDDQTRGGIQFIDRLLALEKPGKSVEVQSTSYS